MAKTIEKIVRVEDRCGEEWRKVESLLDALGWAHYPTNVTGEEIDAGDDSDAAKDESIEVPRHQMDVYDFLDEMFIFDDC